MRAKLFNRLFDYKIFYEIFFLQFLRTLKSHLRLDIKIFCHTYDFCLLCSCQSSEKKIEKKKNPRSFRIVGGTIWRGKRKRINALYIHAEVKRRARRKRRYNHSGDYGRKVHLFPFRTQKLSFLTPKVLCGTPLGRIGHRRFSVALLSLKQIEGNFFILYI